MHKNIACRLEIFFESGSKVDGMNPFLTTTGGRLLYFIGYGKALCMFFRDKWSEPPEVRCLKFFLSLFRSLFLDLVPQRRQHEINVYMCNQRKVGTLLCVLPVVLVVM